MYIFVVVFTSVRNERILWSRRRVTVSRIGHQRSTKIVVLRKRSVLDGTSKLPIVSVLGSPVEGLWRCLGLRLVEVVLTGLTRIHSLQITPY